MVSLSATFKPGIKLKKKKKQLHFKQHWVQRKHTARCKNWMFRKILQPLQFICDLVSTLVVWDCAYQAYAPSYWPLDSCSVNICTRAPVTLSSLWSQWREIGTSRVWIVQPHIDFCFWTKCFRTKKKAFSFSTDYTTSLAESTCIIDVYICSEECKPESFSIRDKEPILKSQMLSKVTTVFSTAELWPCQNFKIFCMAINFWLSGSFKLRHSSKSNKPAKLVMWWQVVSRFYLFPEASQLLSTHIWRIRGIKKGLKSSVKDQKPSQGETTSAAVSLEIEQLLHPFWERFQFIIISLHLLVS